MRYKSKYYSIKTKSSDGIVFDSKKEASRWEQLLLLQKAGKINNLRRQVKYELLPAQYRTVERYSKAGRRLKDGKKLIERQVVYVADFCYTNAETGENITEDAKGMRTEAYVLKRKLMLAVHGIQIKEV